MLHARLQGLRSRWQVKVLLAVGVWAVVTVAASLAIFLGSSRTLVLATHDRHDLSSVSHAVVHQAATPTLVVHT